MILSKYWRRYQSDEAPSIAELAAEIKIPASCLSIKFAAQYKEYRRIAASRRNRITISDDATYRSLFKRYRSNEAPTLQDLSRAAKVTPGNLSKHFRRLFGAQYETIASERRAHRQETRDDRYPAAPTSQPGANSHRLSDANETG